MNTRTLLTRALALVVVLFAAADARADLINWAYDWNAMPSFVIAGNGKITLSNEAYNPAAGNSNIVATNLKEFSTASPLTPDTFGPTDGNYTLKMTLYDLGSGMAGFLLFTGQLQGSFSSLNSNVTNTFFTPTTQSIGLGSNYYTVTVNSYTPPGPPAQGNLGSIGAFVQVEGTQHLPEPSSLALAGLGLGTVGFAAWRRRRRRS